MSKTPETMKVKAIRGFFANGEVVKKGAVVELPYKDARYVVSLGKAEPAGDKVAAKESK